MTPTLNAGERKILGVAWNPTSDRLIFEFAELARLANSVQPTKRNVVSVIGRFYDPLGFLAPVTIKFKVFFQQLCRDKIEWDANLPKELTENWNDLLFDLKEGGPVSIPRSYFYHVEGSLISVTLCGFCNASVQAFAAVVYLVMKTRCGTNVQFVVSKTRVAPLQSQTIPRLELLSALLLSKLIVSVSQSLQPTLPQLQLHCYTDSQIALCWIRGVDREWKPFVHNRVKEIRCNVHPSLWSHCPGVSNPADLPTRGLTTLELSVNQLWRQGPDWLGMDLPWTDSEPACMPEECAVELKISGPQSLNLVTTATDTQGLIDSLLRCQDFLP